MVGLLCAARADIWIEFKIRSVTVDDQIVKLQVWDTPLDPLAGELK